MSRIHCTIQIVSGSVWTISCCGNILQYWRATRGGNAAFFGAAIIELESFQNLCGCKESQTRASCRCCNGIDSASDFHQCCAAGNPECLSGHGPQCQDSGSISSAFLLTFHIND